MFDLYLITAELEPAAIVDKLSAALAGAAPGRVAVQLRAPQLVAADRRRLARTLRELTARAGAPLLINADVALALEVGADGVQLPERGPSIEHARAQLPSTAAIGASRHDRDGVQSAARSGATFVTLSPVYGVPGKGEPLGADGFGAIARASSLPVLALGGLTAARVAAVVREGAHGVAVIREIWDSPQPELALRALLAAIDAARGRERAR